MRNFFITGGARSGKSAFALSQAQVLPGKKAFIATAMALDDEMKERIEAHKRQRNSVWDTYEEPIRVAGLVEDLQHRYDVLLIDCLTVWLSNAMHAGLDVMQEIEKLVGAIIIHRQGKALPVQYAGDPVRLVQTLDNKDIHREEGQGYPVAGTSPSPAVFIVSNEVGMGIVPANTLAREFRDYQGLLNQRIAGIADEVYFMVAGIPMKIK